MRPKQDVKNTLTPIEDSKSYPEPAFKAAVGWGRAALRAARDQGLIVVKIAGRNYIRGKDFSDFLAKLASESDSANTPEAPLAAVDLQRIGVARR